VEEQFYLISPLVIRVFPRRVLPIILCAVVIAAPLIRLFVHYYWHPAMSLDPAYILMPCRADALAIGMLAAHLYRDTASRAFLSDHFRLLSGLWVIFVAGAGALTALSPDQHSTVMIFAGYTWLAFFYVVTLLLALVRPTGPVAAVARIRGLRELGRISYCVYIIHQVVILFVLRALPSFAASSTTFRTILVPVVAIGITIGVAQSSWKLLERKLIARGHFNSYVSPHAASDT
jgi:peptidoglycan/LPS O-acetylase OafA/YrhL